jgi:hypothetical protein
MEQNLMVEESDYSLKTQNHNSSTSAKHFEVLNMSVSPSM